MTGVVEAETTVKARDILVKALKAECFHVEEEKILYCENNFDEPQMVPYRADIYASIEFIIELDPVTSHGGDHRTKRDNWRSKNIFRRKGIRTVRLQPEDVLNDPKLELTFQDLLAQLKRYDSEKK